MTAHAADTVSHSPTPLTTPVLAYVCRHAPSAEVLADLRGYRFVPVNPPGRLHIATAWLDCCIACDGRPDVVVLILPPRWLTPFVLHAKRMSPQTRVVRPARVQYDGERWEWNGRWLAWEVHGKGTRLVDWTPERVGE